MLPARSLLLFPFFLILSPVASFPQQAVDLQAPVKAIVFEDDFESALQQYSWSQWKGLNPCWTVRCSGNSALLQEDTRTVPRQVLYAPGKQWRDYGVTCRLRVQSWGGQTKSFAWSGQQYRQVYWAVALRVDDAANGYRLEYAPWVPEGRGNKQPFYKIVKYVGGVRTEITSVLASFHSDLDHLVRF